MRYAIIYDNLVINLTNLLPEHVDDYAASLGEDQSLVSLESEAQVDIGWSYVEGTFSPPIPVILPSQPHRVSKIDFYRLFTDPQKTQLNAWRKATSALTVEDYSDPAKGLIIQLEIVFQLFEMPSEFIELDNPDTQLALMLLSYAGVFGNDEEVAAAEMARIISGTFP